MFTQGLKNFFVYISSGMYQICQPTILYFLDLFFASGVDSSLYPEISTVLHSDPTADQDHCGRRRFRTRDLCPESRGATDEPPQPIKILYSLSFFGAASHVIFLNIGAQGEAGAGHPVAKAEARAGSVSVRGGG